MNNQIETTINFVKSLFAIVWIACMIPFAQRQQTLPAQLPQPGIAQYVERSTDSVVHTPQLSITHETAESRFANPEPDNSVSSIMSGQMLKKRTFGETTSLNVEVDSPIRGLISPDSGAVTSSKRQFSRPRNLDKQWENTRWKGFSVSTAASVVEQNKIVQSLDQWQPVVGIEHASEKMIYAWEHFKKTIQQNAALLRDVQYNPHSTITVSDPRLQQMLKRVHNVNRLVNNYESFQFINHALGMAEQSMVKLNQQFNRTSQLHHAKVMDLIKKHEALKSWSFSLTNLETAILEKATGECPYFISFELDPNDIRNLPKEFTFFGDRLNFQWMKLQQLKFNSGLKVGIYIDNIETVNTFFHTFVSEFERRQLVFNNQNVVNLVQPSISLEESSGASHHIPLYNAQLSLSSIMDARYQYFLKGVFTLFQEDKNGTTFICPITSEPFQF